MSIGLADIFASVRLNLETGKFETDALKSADIVGGKMGAKLKKAVGGAIGAGFGAAFAAMTKGALELDQATAEFTAQTGASAEAAEEFKDTLADLNKTNVQNIAEIGGTLTELKVNFDLTGEAAKTAAAQFLDFARVVGITGTEAVKQFDELVDSGVITVEEMAGMMDVLTVSHQRFGVNINDSISALVAFAPAMKAAGISTETAVGMMNMFQEAGLDGATAAKAFNKALTVVKSPEELQRLIADISATEDPFIRAQKAVDLFGARAGVKLANALKPGAEGLADFTVTVTEATGAVTEAGDALDNSFGGRAQLMIKQVTGQMAEMGDQFGELLIVAALAGPAITGLALKLGGALVGIFGGMPLAILAAGVGITLAVNQLFEMAGAGAREGFYYGFQTGDVTGPARRFGPMTNALVPEAKDAFVPVGEAAAEGAELGIISGFEDTEDAGAALAGAAAAGYRKGAAAIPEAAKRTVEDVRLAIVEGKGGIVSAWRDAMNERNTAANAADQIIINNAEIAAAKKVIADKRATAVEKAEARIRLRNLRASNSELLVQQSQYGTRAEQIAKTKALLTSKALLAGLKDKDPEVRQHWIDVKATLEKQLGNLGAKGEAYGAGFAEGMLKGLKSQNAAIATQARRLQNLLNLHNRREFGGPVTAGTPYIVGERRAEVFVPDTDGTILPSVPAGFGQGGGGLNLTVNVTASGDTSLGQARRFGQAVLDEVANGLREQRARLGAV